MKHLRIIAAVIGVPILLALSACGGGGGGGNGGADPWTTLISRSWSVTAGAENWQCRRIQIPADMYITGFRAIAPPGQHDMNLTVADSSALPVGTPTGNYPCSAGTGILDHMMIYASGIGTDDVLFPDKVGVHLKAGQFINLNMHLVNRNNNSELNGISGVMVKTGTAADVTTEADMFFAGTFNIFLPSDNQTHNAVGGCTTEVDMQVFALWPNMRSLATRQKMTVTHIPTNVTQVVFDTAYDFNQQRVFYPTTPLTIIPGDIIQITCSYVNNTGTDVTFGDSSTKEQCFTGVYRYPIVGASSAFMCVN